jgi:hypothetical protein
MKNRSLNVILINDFNKNEALLALFKPIINSILNILLDSINGDSCIDQINKISVSKEKLDILENTIIDKHIQENVNTNNFQVKDLFFNTFELFKSLILDDNVGSNGKVVGDVEECILYWLEMILADATSKDNRLMSIEIQIELVKLTKNFEFYHVILSDFINVEWIRNIDVNYFIGDRFKNLVNDSNPQDNTLRNLF